MHKLKGIILQDYMNEKRLNYRTIGCDCCTKTEILSLGKLQEHILDLKIALASAEALALNWDSQEPKQQLEEWEL